MMTLSVGFKMKVVDCVKTAIDYIISKENYKTSPEIDVKEGSDVGDGYISKTYAISIQDKSGKVLPLHLFVKYLPEDISPKWKDTLFIAFQTELKFYDEIYPAFSKFQDKKHLKDPFNNVPKYYSTNLGNWEAPPIILENLKSLGYRLRDTKKSVDDHHLKLPIQAFARYHAISYAIKDQEPEVFQKLSRGIFDVLTEHFHKVGMQDVLAKCVDQFLDSLDPISDKKCLDRCKNLYEILSRHILNLRQNIDEYAIISQGDCWSNNIMFLYDDKTDLPIDVKLVDWQCLRFNSPLLDFCYFFYTVATKEILDSTDYYLNLYYDVLAQRIEELGSDPEKMFPYNIFLEHWRKFALFGLSMAFCMIKPQLFEKDEIPNHTKSMEPCVDSFSMVSKHQDKYLSRMKDIVDHFIDKELL